MGKENEFISVSTIEDDPLHKTTHMYIVHHIASYSIQSIIPKFVRNLPFLKPFVDVNTQEP